VPSMGIDGHKWRYWEFSLDWVGKTDLNRVLESWSGRCNIVSGNQDCGATLDVAEEDCWRRLVLQS
jgi:hypothetical protein